MLGEGWVGLGDEGEDLCGREGDLVVEVGEGGRDGDGLEGAARGGEVGVGREAGAGAVGLPLMLEEAGVGVDVGVLGGVGGAGGVGAVLRVGAVGVLGPEAVEDEGGVADALDVGGVGVAVLGRPGEVEEVVVKGLRRGCGRLCDGLGGLHGWFWFGRGGGARVAGGEGGKKGEEEESLLHGGGRIAGCGGQRGRKQGAQKAL